MNNEITEMIDEANAILDGEFVNETPLDWGEALVKDEDIVEIIYELLKSGIGLNLKDTIYDEDYYYTQAKKLLRLIRVKMRQQPTSWQKLMD